MSIKSFKVFGVLCLLAVMFSATPVFAKTHHEKFHELVKKYRDTKSQNKSLQLQLEIQKIEDALHLFMGSIQDFYSYLGASPNVAADLSGDTILDGVEFGNSAQGLVAIDLLKTLLQKQGVPSAVVDEIGQLFVEFLDYSFSYAIDVNLENKGQPGGDQEADAYAMLYTAQRLGVIFSALDGSFRSLSAFTTIAVWLTEGAQAYCGVLADGNTWGADPLNPASEGFAAVNIFFGIAQIIEGVSPNAVQSLPILI